MLTFFTRRRAPGQLGEGALAPRRGAAVSVAKIAASLDPVRVVSSNAGEEPKLGNGAGGTPALPRVPPPDKLPVDATFPAVPVADILESQATLNARLRHAVGGDDAGFAALHLAPIESLARCIHLLPASAHAHFAGAGGLFRQCLECAFYCAQSAGGRIFVAHGSAADRQALEPRWRHAAFLAGLTCGLRQPLGESIVCDDAGGEWPRSLGGLAAWLDELGLARFHVHWLSGARRAGHAEAAEVVGRILAPESLAWLSDGAPEITRTMLAIALGQSEASTTPLGELVDVVRRKVLHHEAARRPSSCDRGRAGRPLEAHLLDAIRARAACGDWRPGLEPGAMLTWRQGALHLRWPEAAAMIVSDLTACGLSGIPRASGSLVDCLAMAGLIVADERDRWVWPRSAWCAAAPDGHGEASLCFADAAAILPAVVAARPAISRAAANLSPASPSAQVPAPEALPCARAWQAALAERRERDAMLLPDGRVAVAHAFASTTHPDVAGLLRDLDRLGWLGRGDWAARGARVGHIDFPGGRRPGLVLTAQAARLLGLVA
jgi:conjugal transfer pilus assembly protein TraI